MDGVKPPALAGLEVAQLAVKPDRAREAGESFEGMLWTQLFQEMRKTSFGPGLFDGESSARSTYEYLFDQAVVQAAMKAGKGLGIAERIAAKAGSASEGTT